MKIKSHLTFLYFACIIGFSCCSTQEQIGYSSDFCLTSESIKISEETTTLLTSSASMELAHKVYDKTGIQYWVVFDENFKKIKFISINDSSFTPCKDSAK